MFFTKYIKPYLLIILVVAVIILFNFLNNAGKLIEGLENSLADSFCPTFAGDSSKLETACGRLTSNNCKSVGCCVFINGNKCLAGGITGPTFKTDKEGNKIIVDNYYYMNKCYGNCQK